MATHGAPRQIFQENWIERSEANHHEYRLMTSLSPGELLPTRQSLLERLRDRQDQASWEEFFNAYWRLLYSVARKAGLTDAEAQDAVQDTVIAVVRHIPKFNHDPSRCSFKSWLMMITRQRIIWQLRRRIPQGPGSTNPSDSEARTATIERVPDPDSLRLEDVWQEEWQKNLVGAALERVKTRVSARQYQIFDLCLLQNWSAQDVASTLGLNRAQVYLAKCRVSAIVRKEVRRLEALSLPEPAPSLAPQPIGGDSPRD